MNRLAYGNLIESMDACDATRSHEMAPSVRLATFFRGRRFVRRFYGSVLLAAAVVLLIAVL
jgi:hypothetical protein